MTRIVVARSLSAVCLGGLILVLGCGENQADAGKSPGAPIPAGVADPGILADPASYQPTQPPTGEIPPPAAGSRAKGGAAGSPAAAAPAGADAAGQAQQAVNDLASFVRDGEVELALRLFDPQQVGPLTEGGVTDGLFKTFERIAQLGRSLSGKLTPEQIAGLTHTLSGVPAEMPAPELLDPGHASLAANPARLLFGMKTAPTALKLLQTPEGWQFQLDKPLEPADASAITVFHDTLQAELDKIIDWSTKATQVDEAALRAAIEKALAGEPSGIGEGTPAGEEKPAEQPRSRGRGRMRPQGG